MYIWELRIWSHFEWDESVLLPTLDALIQYVVRTIKNDSSTLVG
ncbi:hypothetical protein KO116_03505 [Halomonas sp. KO116]|nr:hypothetical protein KO116_03505 [Halomonas sp. KO116]